MTAEDKTTQAAAARGPTARSARPRSLQRRILGRLARPYIRQRAREAGLQATVARLQSEFEHVGTRHGEQIERLESFVRELVLTVESLRRGVADADAAAVWSRRAIEPIAAELYSLPYMSADPFETLPSPVGEVLGYRSPGALVAGSSEYVAFEELFRGPAERVAEMQRPYLELVREHQPVLDVGCGRGEFLSLLAAEGIAATGVDADAGMVSRCRALGLQVSHGDVNEYLEGVEEGSLGTIFSAQVIEHLPHWELRRLLELSTRKLRPGGVFIAETVNPHRISSLKTFWVDLTHQHPIFPEVALASCAIAGFDSAYVFAPAFDGFEAARFQAPAYAVVARAPLRTPVERGGDRDEDDREPGR
jgi:2-polyprenyl-3-methyl-5-hydroxy-6-metoxy-1,4-benzoquinol methylase